LRARTADYFTVTVMLFSTPPPDDPKLIFGAVPLGALPLAAMVNVRLVATVADPIARQLVAVAQL